MSLADKFNIPKSLHDAVRSIMAEETEYQAKVKALMAKMGIKSLNDLSPEEKKAFFNKLDSMHKAKNEEVDEERDPPFTPDKPKKNPGVVPGKHGAGPSVAKHLAKMALKRQQEKKQKSMKEEEEIDEVLDTPSKALGYLAKATLSGLKSGALGTGKFRKRQAGVNKAIEKTKSKIAKMNNEEVEELDEGMSASQIKTLRDAYASIDKIDVSSQSYKNLVAFLDKQDLATLKMLAGAKIKFISGLAQNRVVRKMNESVGSTVGGALGQYAGSKMGLEGPGRVHGEVLGRKLEMFARALLKKLTKEEIELTESHFKVGDKVECIASGMKGEVVKLDEPEEGKYYTVKREDGKMMKYAPDELKKVSEMSEASSPAQQAAIAISMKKAGKKPMKEAEGASKKKETEFHKKLDTLVHKTFGKRPEEMKEAEGGGTSVKGTEANRAMATAQRAKLTMQSAQLRIKQAKEREALSKKKQAIKSEFDPLDEGKSSTGYELYHKDFSSAMQHAYDFAKKKYGITIDPNEIDRHVAMGPRKPSSGKTNSYRLKGDKGALQIQVANLDNKRYELNMYKEDVNDIFSEAMKKDKKEATAKDKSKVVKSGDKLSGKQEPIELQPELKEDKK